MPGLLCKRLDPSQDGMAPIDGYSRSPAAMSKSWFSRKIWTKRSKFVPATLLVGLRVSAVACAAATEAVAVAVYMVGPGPAVVD